MAEGTVSKWERTAERMGSELEVAEAIYSPRIVGR